MAERTAVSDFNGLETYPVSSVGSCQIRSTSSERSTDPRRDPARKFSPELEIIE